MDLSYAQNLEDYVLWQALGGKPPGVYIDVGGGHPVADNVSCWFYLAGWRGIVVEPQENLARMYVHVRPRMPSSAAWRARFRAKLNFTSSTACMACRPCARTPPAPRLSSARNTPPCARPWRR